MSVLCSFMVLILVQNYRQKSLEQKFLVDKSQAVEQVLFQPGDHGCDHRGEEGLSGTARNYTAEMGRCLNTNTGKRKKS